MGTVAADGAPALGAAAAAAAARQQDADVADAGGRVAADRRSSAAVRSAHPSLLIGYQMVVIVHNTTVIGD